MEQQRDVRMKKLTLEPMRPAAPRHGFLGGTLQSMKDIWAHRELHLGNGDYLIHAAIGSTSGTELHRLDDGAALAVHGDGKSTGHVSIRPEFHIDGR